MMSEHTATSAPVAVVTGAASGIGFATLQRLAADGYDLIAADVDPAGLGRGKRAVEALGRSVSTVTVDLADPDAIERHLAPVVAQHEHIDVLVNVAGLGYARTAVETTDEEWDRTIAVNLSAVFKLCRLVLPTMLDAGHGVIVNVASAGAVVGLRSRVAYCASKAGVVGLSRALAADHAGQGLRINAIAPGTVATEWINKILADDPDPVATRRRMEGRQLDGQMGTPEEVAGGIAFLVSDAARFVNGSLFVMDGGFTTV